MISLFLKNLQIYFIQNHRKITHSFSQQNLVYLIAFWYMISTKDLSIFSNNLRGGGNERNVWPTLTHFLEASSITGCSFFFYETINNACTKTKVIKYRKYLPKTKKYQFQWNRFVYWYTLGIFFIGYFSPKKLLQRCVYVKLTATAVAWLGILSNQCYCRD